MELYIGIKTVQAEPMTFGEAVKLGYIRESEKEKHNLNDKGYHVVYNNPNGSKYHSWSPEVVFKQSYFNPVVDGLKKDLGTIKDHIRFRIRNEVTKIVDENLF